MNKGWLELESDPGEKCFTERQTTRLANVSFHLVAVLTNISVIIITTLGSFVVKFLLFSRLYKRCHGLSFYIWIVFCILLYSGLFTLLVEDFGKIMLVFSLGSCVI